MKKKLSLILILVLALSTVFMTGCHEKYDLEEMAKEEEAASNTEEATEENTEDTTEEEAEAAEDSTETEASTTEEVLQGTPPAEILGKTTETSYSNSFFGIKYTTPNENWYIATKEELGQVMGMAASTISDEEILDILENSGFAIDFYALDTTNAATAVTFDSINITIEDIGKMYGILASEKELAESGLETSKQALEAQGWTNVNMEVTEAVFAGVPRVCTVSSAEMDGSKMFQKQIYLKKESYIACITVGSFDEDKTDEILKAFTAL